MTLINRKWENTFRCCHYAIPIIFIWHPTNFFIRSTYLEIKYEVTLLKNSLSKMILCSFSRRFTIVFESVVVESVDFPWRFLNHLRFLLSTVVVLETILEFNSFLKKCYKKKYVSKKVVEKAVLESRDFLRWFLK